MIRYVARLELTTAQLAKCQIPDGATISLCDDAAVYMAPNRSMFAAKSFIVCS